MGTAKFVNDSAQALVDFTRRLPPVFRNTFDAVLGGPLEAVAQFLINALRRNEGLALGQERPFPGEAEITEQIAQKMAAFLRKQYQGRIAERAGNTKTYGVVRGRFEVPIGLDEDLRRGVFATPRTYPAWVRFAGPGPLVTPDIRNNGVLSIGIKLMDVAGEKLLDDEKATQDFTGISAPTFTTPNIADNLELQDHIYRDVPVLYFLSPFNRRFLFHWLDGVMQGLYARSHANPLELRYFSCVPYRFGEGRAVQYTVKPVAKPSSRVPWPRPSDDYLREAMVATLGRTDVVFDFMVQFQTDPHRMPIENAGVRWPERLSPFRKVGALTIPKQEFDIPAQHVFARKLSFNPWHAIAAHRPLGNQNRARRDIYLVNSRLRQAMNAEPHVEPTGDESFGG